MENRFKEDRYKLQGMTVSRKSVIGLGMDDWQKEGGTVS